MPDSRLAQFVLPASIIDDRPDLVVGTMSGMIVMSARVIQDKQQGPMLHYVVWHANLPAMGLHQPVPGEAIPYPWITVDVNNDPANPDSGEWRYEWTMTSGKAKKTVLQGAYCIVPPVAANNNGVIN